MGTEGIRIVVKLNDHRRSKRYRSKKFQRGYMWLLMNTSHLIIPIIIFFSEKLKKVDCEEEYSSIKIIIYFFCIGCVEELV